MAAKQLQWKGVPRGRLPKIQTSTSKGAAASKKLLFPHIDDWLTREGQKAPVRRTNIAQDTLIKEILERKKHESKVISKDLDSELRDRNRKKRLLLRLLSLGPGDFPTDFGHHSRSTLPRPVHLVLLQGQQNESERSLAHRSKPSSEAREAIRTPRIGRGQDGQMRLTGSFPLALPMVFGNHTLDRQSLPAHPIVGDRTSCGWTDKGSQNVIDGHVPALGEIPCDPVRVSSRGPKGSPSTALRKGVTRGLFTKLQTILEVDSSVTTPGGNGSLPPLNPDQARIRDSPSNVSLQGQGATICRNSPGSTRLVTSLGKAIGQSEILHSLSRDGCSGMDGLMESKRRSTYNWIQGLPQSGGFTFDTRTEEISPIGRSFISHRVVETLRPGAEAPPPDEHPRATTTELTSVKGCHLLEHGKASRESAGLISSQKRDDCSPIIGGSRIHSTGGFFARDPHPPSDSATFRRSAVAWNSSDPISRVMPAPGIPIEARSRVSRRVVWARAMVAREMRERDQSLERRAKMDWD